MAPVRRDAHGDQCGGIQADRKTRKPLVEKKRRARINESLQELRLLIADTDLQSKMENAEVLEMTVKRVESILLNRAQEVDAVSREACERFAAGYIQCMHDVHTFVSACPGVDQTVAAELLNHLLESMPTNDQDRLRAAEPPGSNSTWSPSGGVVSPAPSSTSSSSSSSSSSNTSTITTTDDLCSDLDDTESEQSHVSSTEETDPHDASSPVPSKAMWRPW